MTYPPTRAWQFQSLSSGFERTIPLELRYELDYSAMSDDYLPEEIGATELLSKWVRRVEKTYPDRWIPIYWAVQGRDPGDGLFETAPFQSWFDEDRGFLEHFSWPRDAETGERLEWLRLPVTDLAWTDGQADKGGFIQEALGWRPAALQDRVHLDLLTKTTG